MLSSVKMTDEPHSVYRFRDVPFAVDARINERLRVCLDCNNVLIVNAAHDGDATLVFGQCLVCRKIYLLTESSGDRLLCVRLRMSSGCRVE